MQGELGFRDRLLHWIFKPNVDLERLSKSVFGLFLRRGLR